MPDLIIKVVRTYLFPSHIENSRELIFIKIENEVDPSYGESEV